MNNLIQFFDNSLNGLLHPRPPDSKGEPHLLVHDLFHRLLGGLLGAVPVDAGIAARRHRLFLLRRYFQHRHGRAVLDLLERHHAAERKQPAHSGKQ